MTKEYFKLQVVFPNNVVNDEYHHAFLKHTEQQLGVKKTPPEDQMNIMIVLFDSMSRSHATRSLKKTWKFLSEDPATTIMKVNMG